MYICITANKILPILSYTFVKAMARHDTTVVLVIAIIFKFTTHE